MTRAEIICWAAMLALLAVATIALFTLGALIKAVATIGALFLTTFVGAGMVP